MRSVQAATLASVFVLLAACSRSGNQTAQDVNEPPGVSSSAAPGVAWRYAYEFQLPDDAIEAVQEAHASQCEALGPARCRVTGLRYTVSDEQNVSAMLEVKLAPGIARQFGKNATAAVRRAGGRLSNTELTGEDTAPVLEQSARSKTDLQSQMADLQKQLSNGSLKDGERAQLQSQLSELHSLLSQDRAAVADAQRRLASTPMTFQYYGKGGISGFGGRNPITEAFRSFVASLVTMISLLLQALAVLLPWLALALAILLFARSRPGRAVRRFLAPVRDDEM